MVTSSPSCLIRQKPDLHEISDVQCEAKENPLQLDREVLLRNVDYNELVFMP